MKPLSLVLSVILCHIAEDQVSATEPAVAADQTVVTIRLLDSTTVEGTTSTTVLDDLKLEQVLSIQNDLPASSQEMELINSALGTIEANRDRAARDRAVEDLTAIGLPVIGPLLSRLKDTDQHEPRPLYRLYERIIPNTAAGLDRSLALVRLKGAAPIRMKLSEAVITFTAPGQRKQIPCSEIRTLAVRQKLVTKLARVHSIMHCIQVEYLDSGIGLSKTSKLTCAATGFVRLSWATDAWGCGPDGLSKPGPPYTTYIFEGQPYGALIARVSASGKVFFLGKTAVHANLHAGRLNLAINDNQHYQNNIGSFAVTLTATDAYDLGDPQ